MLRLSYRTYKNLAALTGWSALNLLILLLPLSYAQAGEVLSPGQPIFFKETGHTLAYNFRETWEQKGGLAIYGFPLTEVFMEDRVAVQYFERARLEWHADVDQVELGLLGSELTSNRSNESAFRPASPPTGGGGYYFSQTQHNLHDGFLDYWLSKGGLAVFGFPISEEFTEKKPEDGYSYTVQYFERSRFEYHPELQVGSQVVLGHLGRLYLMQHKNAPGWSVLPVDTVSAAWQVLRPSRIRIPRVGLDTEIVEGGFDLSHWDVPRYTAVHYWPVAAFPGSKGNIIIAGHAGYKNTIFDQLPQAQVEDEVIVSVNSSERHYRINLVQEVEPTENWVLRPTQAETLTLITCVPPGSYDKRLIVRAIPVK